jgi:hypothetical protein
MKKLVLIFLILISVIFLGALWLAWNDPGEEDDDAQRMLRGFSEAAKTNIVANTEVEISFNTGRWGKLLWWETYLHIRGDLSEKQKTELQALAGQVRKDYERENGGHHPIRLVFEPPLKRVTH